MLTPEESLHCCKVLRKKAGDEIRLIDGKGTFYKGILDFVSEKRCTANVTESYVNEAIQRNYYLHLAIAPTKQIDRIEWMVEKAVEIGIDEISFIQCKNSERTVVKPERMLKIVESAVKQSMQAFIPKVNELKNFSEFIHSASADQKLLAHCFDLPKKKLQDLQVKDQRSLILIGPEGDFTKEETEAAFQHGFTGIGLGGTRLRTETAGLYVCQAFSILSQL